MGDVVRRSTVRSFDVFDTVLCRRVGAPESVIDVLADRLAREGRTPGPAAGFAAARFVHEGRVNRRLGRHATLREIYAAVAEALNEPPERAEEWAAAGGGAAYDAVTVRAVAPLAVLVEYAAPLLRLGGVLVAWKGARDGGEEAAGAAASARLGLEARAVVRVEPFAGARDRHLHVFLKQTPTPEGFPRRPGVARKRPLG